MRRLTLAVLLGLLLSGLVMPAPASSGSTGRVVPVQAHEVTVSLRRTRTVMLQEPAQHVALYWHGNPHARVTVAFSPDGASFGRPVDAGRDGAETHGATTYGAVLGAADAVTVRVRSDRPISRLTVLAMRDGPGQTTSEPTLGTPAAAAATTQPPVRSRAEWGADESLRSGSPSFAKVQKLIVHHTAGSNSYSSRAEAESQLRSILYFHTQTRGWSDIGYNFLIDKFGTIYEGRWSRPYPAGVDPTGDDVDGDGVVGAHTGGWNSGTLGVAMLGTHTDADITPAARESLEALLAWSAARNGIDPAATEQFTNPSSGATRTTPNVAGHRDYGSTECPGGALYATLPALRRAVAARMAGDSTAPSTPTGLTAVPGRRRVGLEWAASSDDSGEPPRYRVLRARPWRGTYRSVATVTATSYLDTGLRRSTRYAYKVRAVDGAGNLSPAGEPVHTTTR
jgi:hypothetical protein